MEKWTVSGLIDLLSTFNGNMEIKVFENVIRGDGWGYMKERKLENILKTKINNTPKHVERIIHEHISMNMDYEGEKWVESGLKYINTPRV